jgi:hypothetical protein
MSTQSQHSGTVRLVKDADGARLEMRIDGKLTVYQVEDLCPDPAVASPAYRLTKAGPGLFSEPTAYDVAVTEHGAVCSCPDFIYRRANDPEPCKHIRAMRAKGLLPKGNR